MLRFNDRNALNECYVLYIAGSAFLHYNKILKKTLDFWSSRQAILGKIAKTFRGGQVLIFLTDQPIKIVPSCCCLYISVPLQQFSINPTSSGALKFHPRTPTLPSTNSFVLFVHM